MQTQHDEGYRVSDSAVFVFVAAVAFCVRALYLAQARDAPLFEHLVVDGRAYWAWAGRILSGEGTDRVFYQAPLYPYFLAGVRAIVGDSLLGVRVVQAALGSVACGLVFLVGRVAFCRRAGVVASLVLALYAPSVFLETQIQKGVLTFFLTALVLVAVARAHRFPSPLRQGLVGFSIGLLALTREEAILFLPVWAAWSWRSSCGSLPRSRRAGLCALALGCTLPLAPVAWHNWRASGTFVLVTAQAGPNFYIGNNPTAEGFYAPLRDGRGDARYERGDAEQLAEIAVGRELSPGEVSRFWFARALRFIREEPAAWFKLLGRKALLLVNAHEIGDAESQVFYERYAPLLAALAAMLHFGVLLPVAVGGAWLAWRSRPSSRPLLLLALTQAAAVVAFYVFARYRYPLVPVCALFAGQWVVDAFDAIRRRAAGGMVAATVLVALVAVPANWPLLSEEQELAVSHANAAAALLDAGDADGFLEHSRRAMALGSHQARVNLGVALARAGRAEEAAREFLVALAAAPDDPRLLKRLGTALGEADRWEEAVFHLRRSYDLFPDDPETASNLAYALDVLERWSELAAFLERHFERHPGDAAGRTLLDRLRAR